MKHIKRNRSYLSVYLIIVLVILVITYVVVYFNTGFNLYVLLLMLAGFACILRIFLIARSFYKELKENLELQKKEADQEVTINDIINQKEAVEVDELAQQDKELEQLVGLLSEETDPEALGNKLLTQLGKEMHIVQGLLYKYNGASQLFEELCSYAYYGEEEPAPFQMGEGLSGQAARDQKSIVLKDLPDGYAKVISGLGQKEPKMLLISPFVYNGEVVALAELSFFEELNPSKIEKFENILNRLSKHFV